MKIGVVRVFFFNVGVFPDVDGMESLEEYFLYRLKTLFDDGVIKLR